MLGGGGRYWCEGMVVVYYRRCLWGGWGTGVKGWSLLQRMFSMGEVCVCGGGGTGVRGWSLFTTGDVGGGGGLLV